MAFPILASTGTASRFNSALSSITVTNPTGLTAGDEMCLFVLLYETGSSQEITTPSGWTSRHNTAENFVSLACFTKTATAGDVSAGSVTISSTGGSDFMSASIHRITGAVNPTTAFSSEIDIGDFTPSATFLTAITPVVDESLILLFFAGVDNGLDDLPTAGSYTIVPSIALEEECDIGVGTGSAGSLGHAVAKGNYSGRTEITSRGATFSHNLTRKAGSIAVLYSAPQNASADISHIAITPTVESVTGSNTATANITHLAIEHTVESLTASSSSDGTEWTEPTRENTTWTNEQI